MPDIRAQYITFLTTVRPDSKPLVDNVLQWIDQKNIPALTDFFDQDTSGIPKLIVAPGYWTHFPNQEKLLSWAQNIFKEAESLRHLTMFTVRQDGSVNEDDQLLALLYNLIPFEMHPIIQESLRQKYEKEGQTFKKEQGK